MNRDDQLMSEPNKVITDEEIIDDPNAPVDPDGLEPEWEEDEFEIEEDDDNNEIPDDDIIDFDGVSVLEEITETFANDYGTPLEIEDFVIEEINVFGQVKSPNLPSPEGNHGTFVSTTIALNNDGIVEVIDVNILCSGVAWYIVLPGFPFDDVLMAAVDIEKALKENSNHASVEETLLT